MKKFLTVLLVVSVLFTFSFSSAFAATTYYTAEDYLKVYNEALEDTMDLLKSLKKQAVKVDYDAKTGFDANGYAKAAYEAAIDAFMAEFEDAAEEAIEEQIEAVFKVDEKVEAAPKASDVAELTYAGTDLLAEAMADVDCAKEADEANAPIVKAYVEGKVAENKAADYSNKDADRIDSIVGIEKTYKDITPCEYVDALAEEFADALEDAEKEYAEDDDAAALWAAYNQALVDYTAAFEAADLDTLEDSEIIDKETGKEVAGAVDEFMDAAHDFYKNNKFKEDDKIDVEAWYKDFVDEDAKTVFGVKVDITGKEELTKKEAAALNDAFYDVVKAAEEIVEKACDEPEDVVALYDETDEMVATLYKTTKAAAAYEKVVAYGEKLKKQYVLGVKLYDDAKIDAIVEAAEELVYEDLAEGFYTAAEYFAEAMEETEIDPELVSDAFNEFMKAQREAMEKMIQADGTYTKSVKYGADKTPAEDYVYLAEEYAYVGDWEDIAYDTIDALAQAQSYEEIEEIMADAAADFDKLIKKDDPGLKNLKTVKEDLIEGLEEYASECWDLLGSKVQKDYALGQYEAAYDAGVDEINDAKVVSEAKAAYVEAKALFDGLLTDEEIEDAADAVKKMINALPYNAKLTAADKDAVVAAMEAYDDYQDILATKKASLSAEHTVLVDKAEIVCADIYEDLKEALEDLVEEVEEAGDEVWTDAGMDAYLAMKDDVAAQVAEIKDYQKLLKKLDVTNEEISFAANADYAFLQDLLSEYDGFYWAGAEQEEYPIFWYAEVWNVANDVMVASQSGASVAEMQAAMEGFKALTEKQQLYLNEKENDFSGLNYGKEMLAVIDARLVKSVETLKITASSTAKKGSITVKWTVKGDTTAVEAYEIWKSTKHSKGYKKAFTTTKMTYKNTKGLEKGTRYYYKVRAIAYDVNGDKIKSDWSNKARRIAK